MPGILDKVYLGAPVWAQKLMVAGYGAWWFRRRFGADFRDQVRELAARDRWTRAQFTELQDQLLGRLLDAAERSPYYAPLLAGSRGLPPRERLRTLPLLTKETLRTRATELLTGPPDRSTMVYRSSGTTGTPSEIYYTRDFHTLELAIPEARNLGWAGATYRDRRVMFGVRKVCRWDQPKPPFWRISPVEDLAYCSVYHLSPANLPHYVEFLRAYRPQVVMGYPSSLQTVARYLAERGETLPPARGVFTTSETVTAEGRRLMEAAWQCKVWDRYGAVEGCLFASQCEHGRYHVSPEIGVVEILRQDGSEAAPGELGEVVATGLANTLQPLVRYRIGDVARWAREQECPCGRQMPILEAIEGRFEDICVTPDGRELLRFDTVFKGIENIREAQVVQERVDLFQIRVVPGTGFGPADVAQLERNMRLHVGGVRTEVIQVDAIPRTSSGKFRAVVCRLAPEVRRELARRAPNDQGIG